MKEISTEIIRRRVVFREHNLDIENLARQFGLYFLLWQDHFVIIPPCIVNSIPGQVEGLSGKTADEVLERIV